jgi:hypothetical protein
LDSILVPAAADGRKRLGSSARSGPGSHDRIGAVNRAADDRSGNRTPPAAKFAATAMLRGA